MIIIALITITIYHHYREYYYDYCMVGVIKDNSLTHDVFLLQVGTAAVPDNLLEKGLVTGDVHEWIQSASNTDKARRLVSRATDCIEESSDALQLSPAGGVGEGKHISISMSYMT